MSSGSPLNLKRTVKFSPGPSCPAAGQPLNRPLRRDGDTGRFWSLSVTRTVNLEAPVLFDTLGGIATVMVPESFRSWSSTVNRLTTLLRSPFFMRTPVRRSLASQCTPSFLRFPFSPVSWYSQSDRPYTPLVSVTVKAMSFTPVGFGLVMVSLVCLPSSSVVSRNPTLNVSGSFVSGPPSMWNVNGLAVNLPSALDAPLSVIVWIPGGSVTVAILIGAARNSPQRSR